MHTHTHTHIHSYIYINHLILRPHLYPIGVAEGISTLPGQPELVIVEAVSSTTLKVSWQKVTDESELRKIDGWIINLTKLSSFEDTISAAVRGSSVSSSSASNSGSSATATTSTTTTSATSSLQRLSSQQQQNTSTNSAAATAPPSSPPGHHSSPLDDLRIVDASSNASLTTLNSLLAERPGAISLKLNKQNAEFSIDNLKPYTVYQIQMFAYNSNGRSQLTDPIRALTLAPENELTSASNEPDAYVEPQLPDTRKCCLDRGVTLKR